MICYLKHFLGGEHCITILVSAVIFIFFKGRKITLYAFVFTRNVRKHFI